METISVEAGWDGYGSVHATAAGNNFTFYSFSDQPELNNTFRGGSYWLLSQNISTNPTHSPSLPTVRDVALAQAEIAVLGFVFALTTLGNSFILWILLRRRKYNAPMHLFMVNLCLADLVVAFFQVLPQLLWDITERFQGPDMLCRSVKYLQIVGMFASSFMIVAMTVDRHNAICCPLQAYRGGAVSCWNTTIVVAWGLAFILSMPQVFIFSRSEVAPGVFECWGHFVEPWGLKAYVTWMTVAVFVLPTFIITICQVRIFKEIHDNIYLKSERVVSVDMKKNMVLFHLPILKKQASTDRSRASGDEETRNNHHKAYNNSVSHSNTCTEKKSPNSGCEKSGKDVTLQSHSNVPSFEHHSDCCRPSHDHSVLQRNNTSKEDRNNSCKSSVPPCRLAPPLTGVSKAMSKTVRMTLVIVLVYTMCWSPFFIVQLWAAWDPDPPKQGVAFTIFMLLASLNSCTNPWIYTFFSSSVSRELLALLRCRPKRRRSSLHDHSSDINTSTTKDNQF